MKIYIDLLLIFNFIIDLMILYSVGYLLKRNIRFYHLILAAFIGSLSTVCLFFSLSNFELLLIKFLLSVIMIAVSYGYADFTYFKNNMLYFYIVSLFLGGGLYAFNLSFSFSSNELFQNSYQLNFLILVILSPIFISIYVRKMKYDSYKYSKYYKISFIYNHKKYTSLALLDSGNSLKFKNKSVIITDYEIPFTDPYYVYFNTIDRVSFMPCVLLKDIIIEDKTVHDVYLALCKNKISTDGVHFLLHNSMEG